MREQTVRVKSDSRPGGSYGVTRLDCGVYVCECPGYWYRGRCKHADAVETLDRRTPDWREREGVA